MMGVALLTDGGDGLTAEEATTAACAVGMICAFAALWETVYEEEEENKCYLFMVTNYGSRVATVFSLTCDDCSRVMLLQLLLLLLLLQLLQLQFALFHFAMMLNGHLVGMHVRRRRGGLWLRWWPRLLLSCRNMQLHVLRMRRWHRRMLLLRLHRRSDDNVGYLLVLSNSIFGWPLMLSDHNTNAAAGRMSLLLMQKLLIAAGRGWQLRWNRSGQHGQGLRYDMRLRLCSTVAVRWCRSRPMCWRWFIVWNDTATAATAATADNDRCRVDGG